MLETSRDSFSRNSNLGIMATFSIPDRGSCLSIRNLLIINQLNLSLIRWKPLPRLTLDVNLGDAINTTEESYNFIAHLHHETWRNRCHEPKFIDDLVLMNQSLKIFCLTPLSALTLLCQVQVLALPPRQQPLLVCPQMQILVGLAVPFKSSSTCWRLGLESGQKQIASS